MTWTAETIEKDFYRQMRSVHRNRRRSRAVQMDRDICELESLYVSQIEGFSANDMKAREAARSQALAEVFQMEADRRNEEARKPIVGAFLQIGNICINFGGEVKIWKITRRCVFCGRLISICRSQHWNVSVGWIRSSLKVDLPRDVEAMPELPLEKTDSA